MENFLTKSKDFKDEYCCSVVKIGELTPVEGSDFLAKTNIMGTQIVVRKDMTTEGEVMFYAANETALNSKFLSVNNQFEIGCRELNENYPEVKVIMDEYDEKYRNEADTLRAKKKELKGKIGSYTTNAAKLNKKASKLDKDIQNAETEEIKNQLMEEQATLRKKADDATAKALALTTEITNITNQIEKLVKDGAYLVDKAKEMVGFFGKYGRVRCITLKGEPSFGYVFNQESMAKYYPPIADINLEDYVGTDFDTVGDELFVKAYVPPVKVEKRRGSKGEKRNKKLSRFDRMIDGEFAFHYDTLQLGKNMHIMRPEMKVTVSVKIHGTSAIVGKVHVKQPKKLFFLKKWWNGISGLLHINKKFIDYDVVYGPVYSSRNVIKNQYINSETNGGYYGADIYNEWGEIIYPYINEGMIIYGEIMGYVTGRDTPIQKFYDYGCESGENKLMIYRITETLPNGKKYDWNVEDVYQWTIRLIKKMKAAEDPNADRIHPIDILYHGTLGDLYEDVDESEHWNEEVLLRMKNDKQTFGMEELEPMCTHNEVPREGICIRIDDDPISECFKLKSVSFTMKEAIMVDSGEVDMEMMQAYGDQAPEETNEENG